MPGAVERLLAPHSLRTHNITHWMVHPGGPSILEAVQRAHSNCSSVTVLLILERLLRAGRPRPGEWGVMMAFGPGLTLEPCLWRF